MIYRDMHLDNERAKELVGMLKKDESVGYDFEEDGKWETFYFFSEGGKLELGLDKLGGEARFIFNGVLASDFGVKMHPYIPCAATTKRK